MVIDARFRLLIRRLNQLRCDLYLGRLPLLARAHALVELHRIERELDRLDGDDQDED